ncbi:LlaJI family restriction endonuclease [Anaerosporobacter sp.]|uniref:LlaJI family restriction endonuclease n=1 Tax=Anaerosporobacter sp. TaxID=1872529 RepID=UPI00286F4B52|nr:LlaJI family restriction endonuclease [Anaerosporobacter sp.]
MEKESAPLYDCHINTNEGTDTFVGIRSDGEQIKVCFPIGYKLGKTELEQKKDVQLLIRVLSRFSGIKEKLLPQLLMSNPETVNFPIQAYMTILDEYYNRGYYTENERILKVNGSGHKNWPRTVKTQRAYPQDDSFIYLTTVSQESRVDSSNFLTKINEFCVEEAYKKIGFLFSTNTPRKASIPFDERRFLMTLKGKIHSENNDKNKALFSGMIDMIQYVGKKGRNARFFFGTNDFEYVWERLIDFNFGVDNKNYYFPRTSWYLGSAGKHTKSALEPDTIMKKDNKIFILDAKYYRYGDSADPTELPRSTSINKQITYGEYVATALKFRDENGQAPPVYNAFLMPFNKEGKYFTSKQNMLHIGEARGDWKDSGASYERVQGILLDIKWMMERTVKHNKNDICQLAQLVESVINHMDPLAKKTARGNEEGTMTT